MIKYLTIINFILLNTTYSSSDKPQIYFFGVFTRLENPNSIDYYFRCQLRGTFLQWQYNNISLNGFLHTQIGKTVVDARDGFEYTVTLLSSLPNGHGQAEMISLLILSFPSNTSNTFRVNCSGETLSNFYIINSSNTNLTEVQASKQIPNYLVLQHIFSGSLVDKRNITKLYLCGGNSQQIFLSVGSAYFNFSTNDSVGIQKKFVSENGSNMGVTGILMALMPYKLNALLIVVEDENLVVKCWIDDIIILNISYGSPMNPDAMSRPTHVTTNNEYGGNNSNNGIIAVSISTPLAIIFILGIIFLVICIVWFNRNKKNKR